MTETEQRLAVALATGFKQIHQIRNYPQSYGSGSRLLENPQNRLTDQPLDESIGEETDTYRVGWSTSESAMIDWRGRHEYLTDLNVMHVVEANHLTSKEGGDYDSWLWIILKRDWEKEGNNLAHLASWHATAAQKCEAFLKVKGLWKRPK